MNCKKCRREIDETDKDQRISDEALAHVAACTPCRTFRAERIALREMVGSLGVVSAPADFDFRLRARLAAEKSVHPSLARRIFAPTSHAIAIAAAFVLIVAVAVALKQFKSSNDNIERSAAAAPSTDSHKAPAIHNSQNDSTVPNSADTNSAHNVIRDEQATASRPHARDTKPGNPHAIQESVKTSTNTPQNSSGFAATRADNVLLPPANSNSGNEQPGPVSPTQVPVQSPEKRSDEARANDLKPAKRVASGPFAAYGIETVTLNAKDAARLGARGGVVVVAVHTDTPAARSGLRIGDIIEQVDGRAITGEDQAISSPAPITLGIVRDAQHLTIKLTNQSLQEK